ncbi:hypothetical protein GCM10011519_00050 [Marmoricola endophyticus]|uniref:Histidine phosphatase family protein n=1 Tax=Marmoricola endophyticus TaxID=2040280 RepID=A0A917B8U4_9ACTN|nr:histidine phosphatase family protein [Marmoricola endophyticus]GGF30616.1 hypothetical protein GCM10011519_00050 [Marmoricola endophyticus]
MPPSRGWGVGAEPTRLVLVRHGVTAHTADKRFSGGLSGVNPGLTDEGRAQVASAATLLDGSVDALVTSPVRRTVESAAILSERLGLDAVEEPGLAETDFGGWEGLTFGEVRAGHPEQLDAWLGSLDEPAGGTGESFRVVQHRVLAARDRLLASYAGRTVVAVSHVTPIKILVADAVGAPLEAVYRMELAPAAVSEIAYYPEPSLRAFNRT